VDPDRIADVERRIALIEMFLDAQLRESRGISLDEIRAIWRGNGGDASASHKPYSGK
jgi:hypothetical protein